jgi:SAM-dependent methyltransferase
MSGEGSDWQEVAEVFDDRAEEYDRWFEDSLPFQIELQTLRELETPLRSPRLEVGVGSGRFAAALGLEFGVDPALSPLRKAAGRGVAVARAVGEFLPVRPGGVKTIFLLFTLCFLGDHRRVLAECHRVLPREGHLVLGVVNGASRWGEMLRRKKREGNPFYRHARFYEKEVVLAWLAETGFSLIEGRSALFQEPEALRGPEKSKPGLSGDAGFLVMVAGKNKKGGLEPDS